MARKLISTCAVWLTLVPGTSTALELGGIRGQSALNDPFVGEIELLDVTPEELETVKVELGSAEAFREAGADRLPFLATLQFKVKVSPSGRPIIQVTSPRRIREPFLDFLVEVTWAKGRLVKEYTVLLDPPATTSRTPPPVETPAVSKSAHQFQPGPESAPGPADASPGADPPAAQPQDGAKPPVFPLRYGPIKPGEGLWRIARRISPSDATAAQTAMALYRNSQGAFIGGDINKLTVGEQLQIPTAAELYALDADASQRELSTALAGGTVTSAPLTDVAAGAEPEDRLEIATASPQDAAAEAVEPPQEGDAPVPELGVLESELLLVREAGESTRQETQELRERIHDLETQLGDIRRLLELRNEQLAQLQALAALDLEREPSAADAAGAPPSEEVLSAPEEPTERPAQAAARDEAVAAAGTDGDAATPQRGDAVEASDDPPEQAAPTEPEPSVSFWDRSPWGTIPISTLGLGLAITLLVLVLGWMIHRRRRRSDEALMVDSVAADFASVSTVGATGFTPPDSVTASDAGGELRDSAERSSHTIMSYTGFDDIEDESEEADVVSEADVYIAYGRYSEAESLLTEEIAKAPRRLDLKLKLAEAHFGAGDIAALRGLMEDIQRTAGDRITPGQRQRLTVMARDLERAESEVGRARATEPAKPRRRAEPLSFSTGRMSNVGLESDTDLDFPPSDVPDGSMGPLDGRLFQELELVSEEDQHLEDSSFHLAEDDERSDWQLRDLDLERGLDDLSSSRDEDLGDLIAADTGFDRDEAFPLEAGSAGTPISLDTLDMVPAAEDDAPDDISTQWQRDSEPWDPVATKIDLAHAYLEMKDLNAARLILEEVVEEGNEEQRTVARDMLGQLN